MTAPRRSRVLQVWRYPVKSLQGERLDSLPLTPRGLLGDRRFAIFDRETGFGLTARRVPALLFASARLRSDESVEITLPDGSVAADDAALSAWLDRPVSLRSTAQQARPRYENPVDFEHETTTPWKPFAGSAGPFHDSSRANVSMVSAATLQGWAWARFRANLLLDGDDEDALVGSRVSVGKAVLDVTMRIQRCVMTTRPQPGGVERDLDVLRTIHRRRGGCLAVGAVVVKAGVIHVEDEVTVLRDGVAAG